MHNSNQHLSNRSLNGNPSDSPVQRVVIGIDAHKVWYFASVQIDGGTPQPAQRLDRDGLLKRVGKLLAGGAQVHTCYEAGPLGFSLHRKLAELGAHNLVVRARRLGDGYGNRVKTDRRDARELCEALARRVDGNHKAIAPVRVPSIEEERRRSRSRQRAMLVKERKRFEASGRGNALFFGVELTGRWWGPLKWKGYQSELDAFVLDMLAPLRDLLLSIEAKIQEATAALEAEAVVEDESAKPCVRPKGLGKLTTTILQHEVCDWQRFNNRRQVASYTGLCPGESSSGNRRRQGSISKHGNPRLRCALVEAVWRIIRYQPDYVRLRAYHQLMAAHDGKPGPAAKKRCVIAIARALMVDLWRLNTGRTTLAAIGLKPADTD